MKRYKRQFPNIVTNRAVDHRKVRWYAICLTAASKDGINLPLAKAMHDYTMTGQWNVGSGYEKQQLDQITGNFDDPVK